VNDGWSFTVLEKTGTGIMMDFPLFKFNSLGPDKPCCVLLSGTRVLSLTAIDLNVFYLVLILQHDIGC
jgi:hypothetical protein